MSNSPLALITTNPHPVRTTPTLLLLHLLKNQRDSMPTSPLPLAKLKVVILRVRTLPPHRLVQPLLPRLLLGVPLVRPLLVL